MVALASCRPGSPRVLLQELSPEELLVLAIIKPNSRSAVHQELDRRTTKAEVHRILGMPGSHAGRRTLALA